MIPRIIMSMGASRIEAVKDTTSASKQLSLFDYIVVKDTQDIPQTKGLENYVPFHWAKDCLIAGRLLHFNAD